MITASRIETDEQLAVLLTLLEGSKLPFRDINTKGNIFKLYSDENGKLVGCGGLEFYRDAALLRSVAVVETERGKSFGKLIVGDLLQQAKEFAIGRVYLLTETAPVFFANMGFRNITREDVPEAIKSSTEFTLVCPVSAACMEFIV